MSVIPLDEQGTMWRKLFPIKFILLFFLLVSLNFYLSVVSMVMTPAMFWLANVIGICLLLRYKIKTWFLLIFLGGLTNGIIFMLYKHNLHIVLGFTLLNTFEIIFSLIWIKYFQNLLSMYVSSLFRVEESLNYHLTHDKLTGLLNRSEFERILLQAQKECAQTKKTYILAYLDIDNLQMFNEATCYLAGDRLLQAVVRLLRLKLSKEYVIARLGGDEFGILISNISVNSFKKLAQKLISDINAMRFNWNNRVYRVSASMGLALIHKKMNSVDKILNAAELACNTAKHEGGINRVFLADSNPQMLINNYQNVVLANEIHEALDKNRLRIYLQKIVSTQQNDTLEEHHYEVLLRMVDEKGEIIRASVIIPIAERFNIITKIDRWVVSQLLTHHAKTLKDMSNAVFSINISAISLSDPTFLKFLLSAIKKSPFLPHQLCFEITETAMMSRLEKTKHFVREISMLGCKIALDDFGVGLSSFSYLQKFKVDYIKIDGSFVKRAVLLRADWIIVQIINEMAHRLNIKTVAEYVENPVILKAMKEIGVDYVQGFVIDKPQPLDQIFLSNL